MGVQVSDFRIGWGFVFSSLKMFTVKVRVSWTAYRIILVSTDGAWLPEVRTTTANPAAARV